MFIDVQNMYYSAKHLYNRKVNFGNILKYGVGRRELIRAIAYTITAQNREEEAFFTALDKSGLEVKTKDVQVFYTGAKKGDWDIGLAMDAIRLSQKLDVVILVSGDGDFTEMVNYLKYHAGTLVEIMAFKETCSKALTEAADGFINLSDDKRLFLIPERKRKGTRRTIRRSRR